MDKRNHLTTSDIVGTSLITVAMVAAVLVVFPVTRPLFYSFGITVLLLAAYWHLRHYRAINAFTIAGKSPIEFRCSCYICKTVIGISVAIFIIPLLLWFIIKQISGAKR